VGATARSLGADRAAPAHRLAGSVVVDVGAESVREFLVLGAIDPGVTVSGRIALVDPAHALASIERSTLMRELVRQSVASSLPSERWRVDEDGRMEAPDVAAGSFLVRDPYLMNWMLVGASIGERNVLDRTFEIQSGTSIDDLVLTYSSDITSLAGTLRDQNDRPVGGRHVGVFPAEREYWTTFGRRFQHVPTSPDGSFRFDRLPPGEYYVTTATEVRWGVKAEPAELEDLAAAAQRVTVGASGETIVHLTLGVPSPKIATS
jgi:hypothetical protein